MKIRKEQIAALEDDKDDKIDELPLPSIPYVSPSNGWISLANLI